MKVVASTAHIDTLLVAAMALRAVETDQMVVMRIRIEFRCTFGYLVE